MAEAARVGRRVPNPPFLFPNLNPSLIIALASSLYMYYRLIQDVFKANPSFKTWWLKSTTFKRPE